MIEIEKKFLINQAALQKITKGADFLSQQELVDIYYDTADFRLTTKDWWLRCRNGKFELKKVVEGIDKKIIADRYEEITEEHEICQYLGINFGKSLKNSLEKNKINPFATITAERKKYRKDDFTIDFDITDFNYSICEVELMVQDDSQMNQALEKIENFRKANNLKDERVRGKLVEYIYLNRPEHYRALKMAGVVRD